MLTTFKSEVRMLMKVYHQCCWKLEEKLKILEREESRHPRILPIFPKRLQQFFSNRMIETGHGHFIEGLQGIASKYIQSEGSSKFFSQKVVQCDPFQCLWNRIRFEIFTNWLVPFLKFVANQQNHWFVSNERIRIIFQRVARSFWNFCEKRIGILFSFLKFVNDSHPTNVSGQF